MENKLSKQERIKEKEQLSNAVTGKMSVVFVALVAAIIVLVYSTTRISQLTFDLFKISQLVFALLSVAALVRCVLSAKKGKDTRFKVFSPIFTLGLCASALFMSLAFPTIDATYTILALIAIAVLFFVYEIYPIDFFMGTTAIFSACIAAAIIDRPNIKLVMDIVIAVLFLAVLAYCTLVVYNLATKGKVKLSRKRTVKKPRGMVPLAVFACLAVALLTVLGVLLFSNLLYFVAAACVVFFIVAIIYTVKLM